MGALVTCARGVKGVYVFAPVVEGVEADEVFEKARRLALREMARVRGAGYEIGEVTQIEPGKWRVLIVIHAASS